MKYASENKALDYEFSPSREDFDREKAWVRSGFVAVFASPLAQNMRLASVFTGSPDKSCGRENSLSELRSRLHTLLVFGATVCAFYVAGTWETSQTFEVFVFYVAREICVEKVTFLRRARLEKFERFPGHGFPIAEIA